METPIRPQVNRQVFSWAIARLGMTAHDVAVKYPKLSEWQEGKSLATANQLKAFSHEFHFPFGYFFLKEVPTRQESEIPFFRSGGDISALENINVSETVYILKERKNGFQNIWKKAALKRTRLSAALKTLRKCRLLLAALGTFWV